MKKVSALFGVVLLLAACAGEDLPPAAPVSHVLPPKINLDVQTITLADRSGVQPPNSPYNNNHFSPTISEAIKQWASDRLQAVGQSGQTIIIVKDASLTAQPLPLKTGSDSWFTRQQGVKYIGHAEVSLEANGREGFATTDASATRAVTLPENPTPIERQDAYFTLLNGLMKDLGQNLESGIQSHMNPFVITAPLYGVNTAPGSSMGGSSLNNGAGAAPVLGNRTTNPVQTLAPAPMDTSGVSQPMPMAPVFDRPVASLPNLASSPTSFAPPQTSQQAVSIPLSSGYAQ
jgi:hypothetical protein